MTLNNSTLNTNAVKSGTGWTLDVTPCNLLPNTSIRDFVVFLDGNLQGNSDFTKLTPNTIQYNGNALPSNTTVEVRRLTPPDRVQEVQFGTRFSSALFEAELNRIARRNFEYDLNGTLGDATFTAPQIIDETFGTTWATDVNNGATRRSIYDEMQLKADVDDPAFTGTPTAPTVALSTANSQIATTLYVNDKIVAELQGDPTLGDGSTLQSSPLVTDDSDQIATTKFVDDKIDDELQNNAFNLNASTALVASPNSSSLTTQVATTQSVDDRIDTRFSNSPALGGAPTAPTMSVGNANTRVATTAFVHNLLDSGTQLGDGTTLASKPIFSADNTEVASTQWVRDIFQFSPSLGNNSTAETPPTTDDSTRISTTAFVDDRIDFRFLSSPVLDNFAELQSNPPTSNASTRIATTGYVNNVLSADPSLGGDSTLQSTPATGSDSTQIATTAYVRNVLGNSPVLGGNPTAPNASILNDSQQVATTAYVRDLLQNFYNQREVFAYRVFQQTLPDSFTDAKIEINTREYDDAGDFDTVNNEYTVPFDGLYSFQGRVRLFHSSSVSDISELALGLRVENFGGINRSLYGSGFKSNFDLYYEYNGIVNMTLRLTAGTKVWLIARGEASNATNIEVSSGLEETWFSAVMLRRDF